MILGKYIADSSVAAKKVKVEVLQHIHTIAKAADENLSRTDCMDVFGAIALSGVMLQHAFMLGRGGKCIKDLEEQLKVMEEELKNESEAKGSPQGSGPDTAADG